ncbi:hypothetical protein B0H19DRAFT_1259952 [Mycena capillaripes]|nr:hypothetical protein B0H19DRAFT_1259952 [Mycena capillaripes]
MLLPASSYAGRNIFRACSSLPRRGREQSRRRVLSCLHLILPPASHANTLPDRDGYPANPEDIFLPAGASAGVSLLINMLIPEPTAGILIPIPQYPLYTVALAQHHGGPIPYLLDETSGWSASSRPSPLPWAPPRRRARSPRRSSSSTRATPPALLTAETMASSCVCEEHERVLLADEVYQCTTPRTTRSRLSKRSCAISSRPSLTPSPRASRASAGDVAGYFELTNVSEEVRALIHKLVSVGLCPPISGQIG